IGEISSMAFQMKKTGITIIKQDKILAVTMGLSSAYNVVIIMLNSILTEQLMLKEVIR
ncbi:hypothetical protein BV20DRAFT_950148, partial [Pilatotrama ljubarskyi]